MSTQSKPFEEPGRAMHLMHKLKKLIHRDYIADTPRVYRRLGAIWLLRYRNYIDRKLILGERYEREQMAYCATLFETEKFSCLIDIGANFGLYSISIAAKHPQLGKIFAFEPEPRNFNHLSANIYLNKMDRRIIARRIGLSDRKATVDFLANKGNSTGMSRIAETAPESTKHGLFEQTTIEVAPLDSLLPEIEGETVFLKVDVEGHERAVICGARQFFEKNKCVIQMEILGNTAGTILWLKENFGFSCIHQVDSDYYFKNACHLSETGA